MNIGVRCGRGIVAVATIACLACPQLVLAAPPEGPQPAEDAERRGPKSDPVGTISHQGSRRGALELGLGVVLSAAAVGLATFGGFQFVRAREHVEFCNAEPLFIDELDEPMGIDPCQFDPPPLGFASAGLSWGFSAVLLTGAGLLFARGARVLRDARRYGRIEASLGAGWNRRGFGVRVGLRF